MSFLKFRGFLSSISGGCLMVALVSCGPEHIASKVKGNPEATAVPISTLLEKPEDIVFGDVQKYVLIDHCVTCHRPGNLTANIDVTTYEAVTMGTDGSKKSVKPFGPEQSAIYETLIIPAGSRHMPPANKTQLSEDQINLVYQWVINGAKNERTQQVERPQSLQEELQPFFEQPQTIDFVAINKYVFSNSCNKCHSEHGATPNFDDAIENGHNMTSYESVIANKGIVFDRRGNPRLEDFVQKNSEGVRKLVKGSRMYKSIAINQTMPPSRNGYKPMDSLRIKLLRLWVVNCIIKDYSVIDPETDDLKDRPKNGKIRNCPRPN